MNERVGKSNKIHAETVKDLVVKFIFSRNRVKIEMNEKDNDWKIPSNYSFNN
jgi:hypothetical protein